MPYSDPRDRFVHPFFKFMIVSNNIVLHILSSTANATLCLNFNNNIWFQFIYLLFGINVAKPFPEMPCESVMRLAPFALNRFMTDAGVILKVK